MAQSLSPMNDSPFLLPVPYRFLFLASAVYGKPQPQAGDPVGLAGNVGICSTPQLSALVKVLS